MGSILSDTCDSSGLLWHGYWKAVGMLSYFIRVQLCDPRDCSLPGSSVHGIPYARILERLAICYSRGSSRPRDQTHVSCISCSGRQVLFTTVPPGKPGLSLLASFSSNHPPFLSFFLELHIRNKSFTNLESFSLDIKIKQAQI